MIRVWGYAVALMAMLGTAALQPAMAVNVDGYVKNDRFETLKISPTGEYFAATVPVEKKTVLVIMRRSDNKLTATFALGENTHVAGFWWVNPERVLISMAQKFGLLDQPLLTGELYGMNADGGSVDILVGQSITNNLASKIKPKKVEQVAAFLIDDLPDDDKNVIISVSPFNREPYTRADKMDVYTGRRAPVARAPVRNADFTTDNQGAVRFAHGVEGDNASKLYYRSGDGGEWTLVNHEAGTGRIESPVGFSADDATVYLRVQQKQGPDAIVAMDVATGKRTEVLRDDNTDPMRILYRPGTSIPVGAMYMDGKPRTAFFDDASAEARLYRSLEAAFSGQSPYITSSSADGKLTLVQVYSDRNPGDFYVFDTVAKKADYVISRRDWFDPEKMAQVRPVSLKARDGLPLAGYLTLPPGSDGKGLPTIVMAHGGPFGEYDKWGFDTESQLFAAAGYAVLQVNFRGSGNHGRAFQEAGAREWGDKMQDDLTDATRWVIEQGIANPKKICIYGASYGGYAALMGAAKQPELYQCAAGYVGVYDLPMIKSELARGGKRLGNWSSDWVGDDSGLEAKSPNRIADRIKVPVFLAAGGEDEVAPIEHSKRMERALIASGVPVETLYVPTEGHGFYLEANRKTYYTKLLAFLAKSLGGETAGASPNAAAGR